MSPSQEGEWWYLNQPEIIFLCRKVWITLGREELTEAQVASFKELKLHPR